MSANNALGLLLIDGVAGLLMLYGAWRVARSPREWYSYGLVSKTGWIIASLWVSWHCGAALLPVGAIAALWHLHKLSRRQEAGQVGSIPFATGAPVEREGER
jgi:hypothetical protein